MADAPEHADPETLHCLLVSKVPTNLRNGGGLESWVLRAIANPELLQGIRWHSNDAAILIFTNARAAADARSSLRHDAMQVSYMKESFRYVHERDHPMGALPAPTRSGTDSQVAKRLIKHALGPQQRPSASPSSSSGRSPRVGTTGDAPSAVSQAAYLRPVPDLPSARSWRDQQPPGRNRSGYFGGAASFNRGDDRYTDGDRYADRDDDWDGAHWRGGGGASRSADDDEKWQRGDDSLERDGYHGHDGGGSARPRSGEHPASNTSDAVEDARPKPRGRGAGTSTAYKFLSNVGSGARQSQPTDLAASSGHASHDRHAADGTGRNNDADGAAACNLSGIDNAEHSRLDQQRDGRDSDGRDGAGDGNGGGDGDDRWGGGWAADQTGIHPLDSGEAAGDGSDSARQATGGAAQADHSQPEQGRRAVAYRPAAEAATWRAALGGLHKQAAATTTAPAGQLQAHSQADGQPSRRSRDAAGIPAQRASAGSGTQSLPRADHEAQHDVEPALAKPQVRGRGAGSSKAGQHVKQPQVTSAGRGEHPHVHAGATPGPVASSGAVGDAAAIDSASTATSAAAPDTNGHGLGAAAGAHAAAGAVANGGGPNKALLSRLLRGTALQRS